MRPRSILSAGLLAIGLLGCDTKVDTSDLAPEYKPKAGSTIKRTLSHAKCNGADAYLEYENAAGEPVAQCFGQKEDTQICSLATCETSSDMSEAERERLRRERDRTRKKLP